MKQYFVPVLMAAVLVTSCGSGGNPNQFTVSGKIEHAPAKQIFLQQVAYDNAAPTILDSAMLGSDGSYSLKGDVKEQSLFMLVMDRKPVSLFVNDNSDIKISADLDKDFRTPYISNSDATKSLYAFLKEFRSKDSVLATLYSQIESKYMANPNDSSIAAMQGKGNEIMGSLRAYLKDYLQKSTSPAATFYAFNVAGSRNMFSAPEMDTLIRQAGDKFKDHAGFSAFRSLVVQQFAAAKPQASPDTYPLLNRPAPELTMNDTNGKPVSISSFKGKYVLVDFWASWCRPCRAENPNVVAAYNQYKNKNFTILGVSLDSDKQAWLDAIQKDNLTWAHMSDLKQWESAAVPAYMFNGIPFNVLIDPNGIIIAESLRGEALTRKLAEVLQ